MSTPSSLIVLPEWMCIDFYRHKLYRAFSRPCQAGSILILQCSPLAVHHKNTSPTIKPSPLCPRPHDTSSNHTGQLLATHVEHHTNGSCDNSRKDDTETCEQYEFTAHVFLLARVSAPLYSFVWSHCSLAALALVQVAVCLDAVSVAHA